MNHEIRETLRFCELVAMNRHPDCEVVASVRLHPLGWLVGVDVEIRTPVRTKRVYYDAAGDDVLKTAETLSTLIHAGGRPCKHCRMMACLCNKTDARSTLDERA